jgi:acylphosphatase
MMQKQTLQIRVQGVVQGVGFRFTAQMLAHMHGVGGWVANRVDGSVEIEATGTVPQLQAFRAALRSSRVGNRIDNWVERRLPVVDAPHGFHVKG